MKKDIDFKDWKNVYFLVVFALAMVLGVVAYNGVIKSLTDEYEVLSVDLAAKKQEVDVINAQKQRKIRLEENLKLAEKDFVRLKEMFPDEEQIPRRLQDFYAVLRASGVKILSFTPKPGAVKEHHKENLYTISVEAGYHMMGQMFAEIANFKYPTKITNLKVNPNPKIKEEVENSVIHGWTPITMTASFDLITYSSKRD